MTRRRIPVPGIDAPPVDSSAAGKRKAARDANHIPSRREVEQSIREMVIGALHDLGGQHWMVKTAQRFPIAFATLVSRTMALEEEQGPKTITFHVVIEDPRGEVPMAGVINMPPVPLKIVKADDDAQ